MKNLLLVILSIFLISSAAYAQGEYFGRENSGFGTAVDFGFSDGNNATGFGVGVSNNGVVDFSLFYSSETVKRSRGGTTTESVYSLNLTTHLINDQRDPFKMSFLFGASFYKNGHILLAMPIPHIDARLSKSLFLKLYGGIGVGFVSSKNSGYYNSGSSYQNESVVQGGLSFYTNSDNRQVYVFDVGVASINNTTTVSVGVGMFFGSKNNNPLPEPRVLTEEEKEEAKKKRKSGYYGG